MKKAKQKTVRFYTSYDKYWGWQYLSKTTYFDIIEWIKSSNYIIIGEQIIDSKSSSNEIFALLRRK